MTRPTDASTDSTGHPDPAGGPVLPPDEVPVLPPDEVMDPPSGPIPPDHVLDPEPPLPERGPASPIPEPNPGAAPGPSTPQEPVPGTLADVRQR